jgi:uncharacterized membrane protein (UPF0127 family)
MQKKILLLAFMAVLLILSYKFLPYHCNCDAPAVAEIWGYKISPIMLGSAKLTALIADTDALRAQGLSGRSSLPTDTGMLFAFQTPGTYGFWMKDMQFPLDLIWISPEKEIIAIDENATPETYPKAFLPPAPISYVVELPAGFALAHSLKVGQNFSIGQ